MYVTKYVYVCMYVCVYECACDLCGCEYKSVHTYDVCVQLTL